MRHAELDDMLAAGVWGFAVAIWLWVGFFALLGE